MREFIVENLTNTEALSVTVILMNNIIALIVSFFIMFIYKISYVGTAYSRKFNISIGTITIITAMIMSIISNNIALSLGMVFFCFVLMIPPPYLWAGKPQFPDKSGCFA